MKSLEAPTNLAGREMLLRVQALGRDLDRLKKERTKLQEDLESLEVQIKDTEELYEHYDTAIYVLHHKK